MAEQKQGQQDQREGGYGDSAGAQAQERAGSNASGREKPVTDAVDADEALGNRTGGYGGNPSSGEAAPDAEAPRE